MWHRNILFVKNVSKDMTHAEIKHIFNQYGKVGICSINIDHKTGAHRGSCIIEISDIDVFEKLIDQGVVENMAISRFKPKYKKHTSTYVESNDIYRVAPNAGKIDGMTEMITQQIRHMTKN
jgi:RNA recognition motif. (a.k.a. RRM, RBD, or RNP domain)